MISLGEKYQMAIFLYADCSSVGVHQVRVFIVMMAYWVCDVAWVIICVI
jgi:hypothetical protein